MNKQLFNINRLLIVLLSFNSFMYLFAQNPSIPVLANEPSIQSPNASNLGRFGEIPVSPFNGTPQISIPLTKIINGDVIIPISLYYNAEGCRPDEHPTWVGLNWSLNAGGVIKRHVNGTFDEYKRRGYNLNPDSYYDSYSELSESGWADEKSLDHFPDDDRAPDEFSFSFNGISGSFMLNDKGNWVVRSKNNLNLRIEHEVQEEYQLDYPDGRSTTVPRAFVRFTLTTGDGFIYIFGRESEAIEFSQPALPVMGMSNCTVSPNPGYKPIDYTNGIPAPTYDGHAERRNIQASSWHLSEIISPTGRKVKFYYDTDLSFKQMTYSEMSFTNQTPNPNRECIFFNDVNQTRKFLIKSSYLTKIETNNQIVCTFSKSPSLELDWKVRLKSNLLKEYFPGYKYYNGSEIIYMPNWQYHKLDFIELKSSDQTINKISFDYIEKPSERLKLKSVNFISPIEGEKGYNYKIDYNDTLLPKYNSGLDDHWGFYNGRNFWNGDIKHIAQPIIYSQDITSYYDSREPDVNLMQAEIIKKITYPTGGYTEFIFEPHDYSKTIEYGLNVKLNTGIDNKIAGGLRIKKIATYSSSTDEPIIKEYYYIKDYLNGGALSTGILAGKPVYFEQGCGGASDGSVTEPGDCTGYTKFSSSPLNYLNTTNGNHITYSEVVEKIIGSGYSVYTYTNHDNGYLDRPAINQFSYSGNAFFNAAQHNINRHLYKAYGKLDFERGQVKNIKYFDKDKNLLKETINYYNQNSERYNTYVRSKQVMLDPFSKTTFVSACPIYYFYPYLEKSTVKDYTKLDKEIIKTTNYFYDNPTNFLLTRTETSTSKEDLLKTKIYYPDDIVNPNSLGDESLNSLEMSAINNLKLQNRVVEPIQVETYYNNTIVSKQRTNYVIWDNDIISPKNIKTANGSDTLQTEIIYKSYDDNGNPLEVSKIEGSSTVYIWGYNNEYPIAKLENATYIQVSPYVANLKTKSDEDNDRTYGSLGKEGILREALNNLRDAIPNALVTTYTYDPSVGITSKTDPRGYTMYYEYDTFNRLEYVRDDAGKLISENKYGYKN
ncbi:hypothetical protein [Aquimarina aggregata]|uniref:hypothetical protein n=1 Tax=Aquimarina aggregata TaxID=1642818 RepID=UPI002490D7C8|nr:hypothetical protein [Aquimarina aggregata]